MDRRKTSWSTTADLMTSEAAPSPRYTSEVRCHVCSAPDQEVPNGAAVRNLIDELLLVPKTYAAISRIIDPLMESWPEQARISRFSVMRHGQRHLAWEQEAVREIADRRAAEGGNYEDAVGRMLTAKTVFEVIQQRGFDQVVSGELALTVKDLLTATSALAELEREGDLQFSPAAQLSQLDNVIQVIRDYVPEDVWPQILARLDGGGRMGPPSQAPGAIWDEVAK